MFFKFLILNISRKISKIRILIKKKAFILNRLKEKQIIFFEIIDYINYRSLLSFFFLKCDKFGFTLICPFANCNNLCVHQLLLYFYRRGWR